MLSTGNLPSRPRCLEIKGSKRSDGNSHDDDDSAARLDSKLCEDRQFNFSIRDYVCREREKGLKKNWPFHPKHLQLCLKNGIKDVLPPFEPPNSFTPWYCLNSVVAECQVCRAEDFNNKEECIERKLESPKNERIVPNSSISLDAMASKVCPVCKEFSSMSNTTLNAHIDQCLLDSSTPAFVGNKTIEHKVKPRKMRLLSDIYATAKPCTIEDLDRRNGTNWALTSRPRPFADEHPSGSIKRRKFQMDNHDDTDVNGVYVDSNGTKLRILSKFENQPKLSSKEAKSEKHFKAMKKKNGLLEPKICSLGLPGSKIPKLKNNGKKISIISVRDGQDQQVSKEMINMKGAESKISPEREARVQLRSPGPLKQWACSKRSGLSNRTTDKGGPGAGDNQDGFTFSSDGCMRNSTTQRTNTVKGTSSVPIDEHLSLVKTGKTSKKKFLKNSEVKKKSKKGTGIKKKTPNDGEIDVDRVKANLSIEIPVCRAISQYDGFSTPSEGVTNRNSPNMENMYDTSDCPRRDLSSDCGEVIEGGWFGRGNAQKELHLERRESLAPMKFKEAEGVSGPSPLPQSETAFVLAEVAETAEALNGSLEHPESSIEVQPESALSGASEEEDAHGGDEVINDQIHFSHAAKEDIRDKAHAKKCIVSASESMSRGDYSGIPKPIVFASVSQSGDSTVGPPNACYPQYVLSSFPLSLNQSRLIANDRTQLPCAIRPTEADPYALSCIRPVAAGEMFSPSHLQFEDSLSTDMFNVGQPYHHTPYAGVPSPYFQAYQLLPNGKLAIGRIPQPVMGIEVPTQLPISHSHEKHDCNCSIRLSQNTQMARQSSSILPEAFVGIDSQIQRQRSMKNSTSIYEPDSSWRVDAASSSPYHGNCTSPDAHERCHVQGGANPILRLMGKNLMVASKDEEKSTHFQSSSHADSKYLTILGFPGSSGESESTHMVQKGSVVSDQNSSKRTRSSHAPSSQTGRGNLPRVLSSFDGHIGEPRTYASQLQDGIGISATMQKNPTGACNQVGAFGVERHVFDLDASRKETSFPKSPREVIIIGDSPESSKPNMGRTDKCSSRAMSDYSSYDSYLHPSATNPDMRHVGPSSSFQVQHPFISHADVGSKFLMPFSGVQNSSSYSRLGVSPSPGTLDRSPFSLHSFATGQLNPTLYSSQRLQ